MTALVPFAERRIIDVEKRVKESMTEQVFIIRATYINGYGRLFGGQLMQWIDELAEWQGGEKRYRLRKLRRQDGY